MVNHSLKIKPRFALVLAVLLPTLVVVGWAGVHGLQTERAAVTRLYENHILNAEQATDLGVRLGDAHAATLELLADRARPAQIASVTSELFSGISSDIAVGIATVRTESADSPAELADVAIIADGWNQLQHVRAGGALSGSSPTAVGREVDVVERIFDPMTAAAKSIVHIEAGQAQASYQRALTNYQSSVHLMLFVLLLGLVLAGGVVGWLIRSVLTRTLEYSAFAGRVIEGDYSQRLDPRGRDELDQLGMTLNTLAERREVEDTYEAAKLAFSDMMQLTETEQEAHDLLKRHLERMIAGSTATILNRNNSADRLEAVTAVSDGSPLLETLQGAKPRSCLAMRMARPMVRGSSTSLLSCPVCAALPGLSACTPLLVAGEVIGSVLVNDAQPLGAAAERTIREAVTQSAPVLGNLRNLAIAELRAATDGLTGLPNRRALQDAIKRMVAQSSRTVTPLAVLLCDLDHFKEINDRFGHGRGDDVLAAVGAALTHTVRASDFVGRYGGEEFLILLPVTGRAGALEMAERVRTAVAEIRVPLVDHQVTMSVGIALLPDHAADAESLERAADRALYGAKNAGRDRVEIFGTTPTSGRVAAIVAASRIVEAGALRGSED